MNSVYARSYKVISRIGNVKNEDIFEGSPLGDGGALRLIFRKFTFPKSSHHGDKCKW
jgi:hypothetical protein